VSVTPQCFEPGESLILVKISDRLSPRCCKRWGIGFHIWKCLLRSCVNNQNGPVGYLLGVVWCKNLSWKISWDCPFNKNNTAVVISCGDSENNVCCIFRSKRKIYCQYIQLEFWLCFSEFLQQMSASWILFRKIYIFAYNIYTNKPVVVKSRL